MTKPEASGGLPLVPAGDRRADPDDSPVRAWLRRWRAEEGTEAQRADVALVGVPFDGAVIGRPGARGGPDAVRAALAGLQTYDPAVDLDLVDWLQIVDAGDVAVLRQDAAATHRRVETVVAALAARSVPVVLGGDHSISYATVRGAAAARGQLGLLQFDAHHDVRRVRDGFVSSGTAFRRLLEDRPRRIDPGRFVQVGIAAWRNSRTYTRFAREQGICVVGAADVHDRGVRAVTAEALERAGPSGGAFFVSFDLDVLDTPQLPGTSAHSPGGLTTAQAAAALRAAGRHPGCVGLDVVELAPSLDPTGWSAEAAAHLVMEFLGGLAERARARRRGG